MKGIFTTIISSVLFLSLGFYDNSQIVNQTENPYLLLAKIKNSSGMCIDEYVNTIIDHTDITADMILGKARDEDSWLYKEFIKDAVYMGKVHKMHASLRNKFSAKDLQGEENFHELKAEFPHYARVLPIFSSVDGR